MAADMVIQGVGSYQLPLTDFSSCSYSLEQWLYRVGCLRKAACESPTGKEPGSCPSWETSYQRGAALAFQSMVLTEESRTTWLKKLCTFGHTGCPVPRSTILHTSQWQRLNPCPMLYRKTPSCSSSPSLQEWYIGNR